MVDLCNVWPHSLLSCLLLAAHHCTSTTNSNSSCKKKRISLLVSTFLLVQELAWLVESSCPGREIDTKLNGCVACFCRLMVSAVRSWVWVCKLKFWSPFIRISHFSSPAKIRFNRPSCRIISQPTKWWRVRRGCCHHISHFVNDLLLLPARFEGTRRRQWRARKWRWFRIIRHHQSRHSIYWI